MILLVLALALQSAPAEADRPYGGKLVSAQTPVELARCVAKQLDKAGTVEQAQEGERATLFFTFKVIPFLPGNGGHMQLSAAPEGGGSVLTGTYGHPISTRTMDRQFRIFAKKCGGAVTPAA